MYQVEHSAGAAALLIKEPLTSKLLSKLGRSLIQQIVSIRALWQDEVGDLGILDSFPNLRALHIVNRTAQDISAISDLRKLQTLRVESRSQLDINLASWPSLQELAAEWNGELSFGSSSQLKILRIWHWKEPNLSKLVDLPNLNELELNFGKLHSVDGIECCVHLAKLSIGNMRRLDSFEAIGKLRELSALRIYTCTKLRSIADFVGLQNLRILEVDNVGKIESLAPIREMPKLEELDFRESTFVVDGNTALIKEHGISKYAFQNRKHYNFKYDHISGKELLK